MTLTAVSLFAGVGGFDLAMERNGINVVSAVEIDKKARAVLAKQFPNTHIFEDVQEVTGEQLRATGFIPERGIITGGFPCQDLSVAGRRAGLDGSRSGLFWHIMRLLDELHPAWVVLENVPGLLSSQRGRDMGIVLKALGERGYGFTYRVLDSQFFGVPQRRRRVFIVGHLGGDGRTSAQVLLEPESGGGNSAPINPERKEVAGTLGGGSVLGGWASDTDRMTFIPVFTKRRRDRTNEDFETCNEGGPSPTLNVMDNATEAFATVLAFSHNQGMDIQPSEKATPTLRAGGGGASVLTRSVVAPTLSASNDPSRSPQSSEITAQVESVNRATGAVRRLTPRECERLQGFPDDWTAGQADSHRYRQMGNAVTVPVVEWIMRRLIKVDESNNRKDPQ